MTRPPSPREIMLVELVMELSSECHQTDPSIVYVISRNIPYKPRTPRILTFL